MELKKVLPLSAKINEKGHLEIGGCDTVELVEHYGTPLFVYDELTLRKNMERYRLAFSQHTQNYEIIYAGKAFMCLALCEILKEERLSLDVSSGGEIYTAWKAGFPLKNCYFHGNNKTPDEIRLALNLGVGRFVVDSFCEMDLLEELSSEVDKQVEVLIRVTPGILPSTHAYIQTGQVDTKFGFGLSGNLALQALQKLLEGYPHLKPVGLHIHIGSQIFVLHSFVKAIEVIVDFMKEANEKLGFECGELDLGGGLGISYQVSDEPSTIEEFVKLVVEKVREETEKKNLPFPKIMVEPGRSIVGQAAVTLYRVGTIKEIPGVRTYISVDGGMSDNLRPMLYGAVYEALIANRAGERPTSRITIAGKHCESGDILIKDAYLPMPRVGDILCTPSTGAYGYAMANNYNRQPRPGVILVKEGRAKAIIRRETYDDLIRLDEPYLKNWEV
jgi:diaminopimelate decarboxylase